MVIHFLQNLQNFLQKDSFRHHQWTILSESHVAYQKAIVAYRQKHKPIAGYRQQHIAMFIRFLRGYLLAEVKQSFELRSHRTLSNIPLIEP
jgi:hypothetical protein